MLTYMLHMTGNIPFQLRVTHAHTLKYVTLQTPRSSLLQWQQLTLSTFTFMKYSFCV